jgi:signal transduction histidine kinase/ActR/RegA family two-component response regulator
MGCGPTKRILLIDADPAVHDDFRRILCAPPSGVDGRVAAESEAAAIVAPLLQDIEIDSANDGRGGLQRLQESLDRRCPHQLAVVGVGVAGEWDGVETVRQLWQHDATLPVVLCTAGREPAMREQIVRRLGWLDQFLFLSLPLDPIEVRQAVAAQLDRRLARQETTAEMASLQRSLQQMREEAADSARAKNEFVANVSHEMRTPMNAIIGFTRLLMREPLSAEQYRKLEYVYDAANDLLGLLNNVIDYAQLATGQKHLSDTAFKLDAVIRDLLAEYREEAVEKGLSIEYRIVEAVPDWLEGDVSCLRQVLGNLVSNAVKFTERGDIHILATLDEETERSATVRLVVNDTGIGIPADRQAVIFEGFSQVDGSTRRKYGGMGLGLAVCKQTVDLMGGQIGFRSTPGKGSSFWISSTFRKRVAGAADVADRVPVENRATPRHADGTAELFEPAVPRRNGKPRVLVAEDDPVNRTLAEMLLGRAGCLIDLAGNGHEVLALIREHDYDLVLMDIEMPEMDGLEAIEEIRRREARNGRHVPIVAMTAHTAIGERERCLASGVDRYLQKPVEPEVLLDVMQLYIHQFVDASCDRAAGVGIDDLGRPAADQIMRDCLQRLCRAWVEKNYDELEATAAAVKDLSLQIGAKSIADHALRVQLAARSSDARQAATAIERLQAALQSQGAAPMQALTVPCLSEGGDTHEIPDC